MATESQVVGELRGFSGSLIEIRRRCGMTVVRKCVTNPGKLRAEMRKLSILRNQGRGSGLFRAPEAWTCHDDPGCYEIHYIRAVTLEEHLQTCTVPEVQKWAWRCGDIVEFFRSVHLHRGSKDGQTDYLLSVVAHSPVPQVYPRHEQLVREIQTASSDDPTTNHGDLTLDNIMVTPDGELYLIDPLLNRVETYQWDVAKLLQSAYADWWEIRGVREDRSHRLRLFCRELLDRLSGHDLRRSALFLGVVLLRILKYAPQACQREALTARACVMFDQHLGVRSLFGMEDGRWT